MVALLGLGGLIGTMVLLVMFIIKVIKKQHKKNVLIALSVCFALFVVALAIPSDNEMEKTITTEKTSQTKEENQSVESEQSKTIEETSQTEEKIQSVESEQSKTIEETSQTEEKIQSAESEQSKTMEKTSQTEEKNKLDKSEQTDTVKIESSITTPQLYKDFYEPYTDSMGKLNYYGFSTVEKLNNYRVEYTPGSEEDLCVYKIYAENGDYVYMSFYPANIEDDPDNWIETLSLLCYESSDEKEISISDNFHVGNTLKYSTHDPNREPKNVEVNSVDELVAFMFGQ